MTGVQTCALPIFYWGVNELMTNRLGIVCGYIGDLVAPISILVNILIAYSVHERKSALVVFIVFLAVSIALFLFGRSLQFIFTGKFWKRAQ